jgi:hypothetical protein
MKQASQSKNTTELFLEVAQIAAWPGCRLVTDTYGLPQHLQANIAVIPNPFQFTTH